MEVGSNIKSYRDLSIWQKTKSFAILVYKITEKFPQSELYGLTSQMRRAAVAMPSNIAEGFRRKSKKEKLQFLRIAYGSGSELETQLEISHELKYMDDLIYKNIAKELDETMRMMNGAISSLDT